MWNIKKEVMNAARDLDVNLEQIPVDQAQSLVSNIVDKYAAGKLRLWIYEHLVDYEAVCNDESWTWIPEFVGESESIVFFFPKDEKIAFKFESGKQIVNVVSECFNFDFCVTNIDNDYLLIIDSAHDILYACGNAKEWLKTKK